MHATPAQYAQAWYEALKSADQKQWPEISQAVLLRLQKEGKLSFLSQIRQQMEQIELTERGAVKVTVKTAHDLDKQVVSQLVKQLLAAEVELEIREDKNLLGGIVVETADRRWDLSARGQLKQLKQQLTS